MDAGAVAATAVVLAATGGMAALVTWAGRPPEAPQDRDDDSPGTP